MSENDRHQAEGEELQRLEAASRARRERRWQRRKWIVILLCVAVGAGGIALGWPKARRAYDRWNAARAVQRAAAALEKGDYERALLDARAALEVDSTDIDATRIVAQTLEKLSPQDAVRWRQRLRQMQSGDTENLIALSKGTMGAGYLETASDALEQVKHEDRNTAEYHDAAAQVALTRGDEAVAEEHWEAAARLKPEEKRFHLSLAALRMKRDGPERELALAALRGLAAEPASALAAQRALLTDAMTRRDMAKSRELADAIASAEGATFSDKLTRAALLRVAQDPRATEELERLRDSLLAAPGELQRLLFWMAEHGQALLVLEWARDLPAELTGKPPVLVAIAEARVRATDWAWLVDEMPAEGWGELEFMRLAYRSRAFRGLEERENSETEWTRAVSATQGRPARMDALAKLAYGWRWEDKAAAVLWKYAQTGTAPRAVLDTLWDGAMRRGDSGRMLELAKLRVKADPASIEARNNVVLLQLLTRSNEVGIHEAADALLDDAPGNPDVVATCAWSLHQRGHTVEAIDTLKKLPPDELRRPGVARYYGAILADAGHHEEAREYLTAGSEGFLLAEEDALLARAKAAANSAAPPAPK